ncbi:MAG: amidohydrolase family protein, partial [Parasulfuritortus sp.]|nr:amidohydrolase family protein [Parasulfuritortus sp.]
MTAPLSGRILTPSGWHDGTLEFTDQGRVGAIHAEPVPPGPAERYLLPGFIDLHVHGGGGADIMEAGDAVATVAHSHAQHGTTSLLATTMTAPHIDIVAALTDLGHACKHRSPGGARLLGVHLEGPYINPAKLGAQPAAAREAVWAEIDAYCRLAPVRLLTLAPEIAGHQDFIRELVSKGIIVQLGHSLASYEQGVTALKNGAAGFTH